jgi:hypothetical protein
MDKNQTNGSASGTADVEPIELLINFCNATKHLDFKAMADMYQTKVIDALAGDPMYAVNNPTEFRALAVNGQLYGAAAPLIAKFKQLEIQYFAKGNRYDAEEETVQSQGDDGIEAELQEIIGSDVGAQAVIEHDEGEVAGQKLPSAGPEEAAPRSLKKRRRIN